MYKLKVINLDTVSSTNDYAWDLGLEGKPEITAVLAREQTQGKGRLDRTWASPRDKGLYLSLLLRPENQANLPLLSLLTAYSVVSGVKDILDLKIKWPNDLFCRDKKIGGILLKARSKGARPDFVVLGLGLNINSRAEDLPEQASSFFLLSEKQYKISDIFDKIINSFCSLYDQFLTGNTKEIAARICPYLDTLDKQVKVLIKNKWLEGKAVAIDENGSLFIKKKDTTVFRVLSQEIVHLR